MPLKTTCIGAYPKPDYVPIRDWFQVGHDAEDYNDTVLRGWSEAPEIQEALDRATAQVVADQIACGVDVPTDGEVRRDNYVHYQCRHFEGFDFQNLTKRVLRNGAYVAELPTIRSAVRATGENVLVRDWQVAQAAAPDRPVKITLPGPMTISDTTADEHYRDPRAQAFDLAAALNAEARALAEAGCTHIQIDEPIFARKPDQALDFGVEALRRCFDGLPDTVTRVMHMCCGYPNRLDDMDYPKADQDSYVQIARAVDGVADEISIEDAHRHNPAELFGLFERSKLIVGFVTVASSRVEPVEEIAARMAAILEHLPPERLIAAPDCGLGFLGRDLAMTKLRNLSQAATSV
ncbi:5-methyltetrahydropteroyltriglutamate--homocysteine methyltransferase [Candidatus Rhodobacter oscarellae]|uniref:5-methyltetrahydropteroyltriglutamate--homocysteine methyltransferase n=1 Tax=Candidatus Rhodobacter oscarellae TaxID=1675527 RepID=A0A0J9E471_9RHOB|nr:cobalamin-independent methionine synthase II family protein [Candidatus Rhodobacter lobularis]KMW57575.1 5-methyltetrahydropteroyltriglutamate--homocysteine methyltransferase [Candidatus Rhodobacter lobularis]